MASFESYPEPEPQKEPKPKRFGLRVVLAVAIVVLLVAGIAIGMLVWRNSSLSSSRQSDTEALTQGSAGVNDTKFSAVKIKGIPAYSAIYGKTTKQIGAAKGSKIVFSTSPTKMGADDKAMLGGASSNLKKSIRYVAHATVKDESGVSATFFLNKSKKTIAVVYKFDLDALGVAEADFAIYANNTVVPKSLLTSVGISDSVASSATAAGPAIAEEDGLRTSSYSGKTGEKLKTTTKTKKVYSKKKHKKVKKKVKVSKQVDFMDWSLKQSYSYGANSAVTRAAIVTLR